MNKGQKDSFLYSILYRIESEDELDRKLEKLIGSGTFFRENVQLILADSAGNELTEMIGKSLAERFPENVSYVLLTDKNLAECYNAVLPMATGRYINFSKDTTGLSADNLQEIHTFIKDHGNAGVMCMFPQYPDVKGKAVSYLAGKPRDYTASIQDEESFNLYLFSYFMKRELVRAKRFDEGLSIDSEIPFLLDVLMEIGEYEFTSVILSCEEALETDFYNYASIYEKDWYTRSFRDILCPMLDKYRESRLVQSVAAYLVELRFAANRNDRNKNILLKDDLQGFFDAMKDVLQRIEDDILVKYTFAGVNLLPKYMGLVLLRIKYGDEALMPDISASTTEFAASYQSVLLDKSGAMKVNLMAIDYEDSALIFDGELTNAYILNFDEIQLYADVTTEQGTRQYSVMKNEIYSLDKYFGFSMKKGYTFQVRIPLNKEEHLRHSIVFILRYKFCTVNLPLVFAKSQARLVNDFGLSYWRFEDYVLFYKGKGHELIARPCGKGFLLDREVKLMLQYLKKAKSTVDKKRSCKAIALRCAYWMTKPFFSKKQVWMTFDQLFKGGDNGEYFFRYVEELKRKDLKIYYVINKNSGDYKRLKADYKHVLGFNTIYHKLVSLHTDMVFATRVDVKLYCGYGPELDRYFRGLLDYQIFCLQHGLTIQRIAQYQNRLFDNTKLYFCVSPYEIDNLMHPVYGYEKEVLKLTGAPRYDGLKNNDKRQILITPTWRRNVTSGTNKKGYMHDYSPNFKNTEYYRLYNSLINDERLIECAKRCNYRLIYLLHPILSPQLDDFTRNDYVEIIAGANNDLNYETILTESSLMVTDYSGVQFDFAYMRKPIVYYHPDTLPPQYDEGGLNYSTMSFGPVCKNHEQIVDCLCAYMEKDCKLEDMYVKRANQFFAFDDHQNCKRVFEAAQEFLHRNS